MAADTKEQALDLVAAVFTRAGARLHAHRPAKVARPNSARGVDAPEPKGVAA